MKKGIPYLCLQCGTPQDGRPHRKWCPTLDPNFPKGRVIGLETQPKKKELYSLYHVTGCEKVAFYTTRILQEGDSINGFEVVLLDGSHPRDLVDNMICGSCGEGVNAGDLDYSKIPATTAKEYLASIKNDTRKKELENFNKRWLLAFLLVVLFMEVMIFINGWY